ncbi:hypothetical protein SLS62_007052 [Diatrype stigma]|uniref:Uncharacterized protein n=1 Tax=Diatrype stigma TaxID=117547 RepID=A0AAN9UQ23_9PEZI
MTKNEKLTKTSTAQVAAPMWHAQSPEERKIWNDMEEEEARQHKIMYPGYKRQRRPSSAIQRRRKPADKTADKAANGISSSGNGTAARKIQPSKEAGPSKKAGGSHVPEVHHEEIQHLSAEIQPAPPISGTGIGGAGLDIPDFGGADFGIPNSGGTDFAIPDLGGTDFGIHNFGGADFGGADVGGAGFGGTDFAIPDLGGTDFGILNFGGADSGGADFAIPNFGGANLSGPSEGQALSHVETQEITGAPDMDEADAELARVLLEYLQNDHA